MSRMRQFARICSLAAALALVGYGIIQPVEQDTRWLVSLWLAAPLLLLAVHLSIPPRPRGVGRSVQNLGLTVALGFVLLSFQLLRQQFVRADMIYNWVYVDEQTGQSTSNVRPVLVSQRIKRGRLLDRDGLVLVDSQEVAGGRFVRTYPLADQFDPAGFSNLVGFFSNRYGVSGLEATYNDYLNGDKDTVGRIRTSMLGQRQSGDDLHLTINAQLQARAAAILGDRTGSIVLLNPETGAVLAMVSKPGYDPRGLSFNYGAEDWDAEAVRVAEYWSLLNSEGSGQPLLNRPTQGRYPPGSTYKTVTAIGALQHPDKGQPDNITCPNELPTEAGAPPVVNAVPNLGQLIGRPSLEGVYAFSCNTAFAQYSLRLGAELMAETARQFDIYRPREAPDSYTGFTDLPTDPSLLFVDTGFLNSPPALADTGYGQGQLLVTPLQMAMVAATIANDGVIVQPYLVDRITRPTGETVTVHGTRVLRRAMSPQIAAEMRKNMRAGVEYGFGAPAQQVAPSVALVGGKSGTAEHGVGQVPHAWFIAIAPVEQPRYAVAVMIESGGEGSSVGARAAGDMLAAAFELE